jgi:hypothetical protein
MRIEIKKIGFTKPLLNLPNSVGVYIVQMVHSTVDGRTVDRLHLEVSFR